MIGRRLVRIALALFGLGSVACGSSAAPAPSAPARRHSARPDDAGLRGPLLWEVQGAAGPSYLFGTIHAGFQADKELPAWVWDKLDASNTFIMELDPTSIPVVELARMGQLPDGKSLDQMLGAKDFAALASLLATPPDSLKRLQPWAALLLVTQRLYPTPLPLDLALRERAAAKGKNLVYLEDWKLQAEIISMMDIGDLRELLDARGPARVQLERLVAAYRAGDFEKLAAIGLDPQEIAKNPARHARMLDDRNRDWVGKLLPHLERGGAFVAVGALHFAGEHGLIELLRARGLVLTRVVSP
jgi:uncharacterized protein YbaP (TraB family)